MNLLTRTQIHLPFTEERRVVAPAQPKKFPVRWKPFFIAIGVLAVCYCVPLWQLLRLAAHSQLYSYIPLIPFVSVWFAWQHRNRLPAISEPARVIAAYFFAIAIAALVYFCIKTATVAPEDYLSATIFSLVSFVAGAVALFLGKETFRALVFPLCLLIFMVPLPAELLRLTETFLQIGSAACANALFALTGTPFFQDGLQFQLPGINLHVAPECSGIHSSLVLFITSFVAAKLFLRNPWLRAVLIIATIPLALARNGFRIFVIGELCIRHGAQVLDWPIHRHGGPLFFVLSLFPLFGLLLLLRWQERKNSNR
ncbi:MAG TPA: exosortase/archaeosortase family protein [Verrucomicrobiae bacterium]|nr:exosortase/archaeosortase family protein [Verrucomicrobiae bacterium]